MLVQSAIGTLPVVTHITRSTSRQMSVHCVVERGKNFWKQYPKDDLIFICDQIKWYPANEGGGSGSPCLEHRHLDTLWWIQKEYVLPANGVSLSDLAGSCSISALLHALFFLTCWASELHKWQIRQGRPLGSRIGRRRRRRSFSSAGSADVLSQRAVEGLDELH